VTGTAIVADGLADRARTTHHAILQTLDTRGTRNGHLVKWLGGDAVDGSLSALISPLLVIDPRSPTAEATIRAVEQDLCADGGVYRFRADTFFGGGRWPLLTCFLGLARLASGDQKGALACLTWAAATATPDGDLPEQLDGGLLLHPSDKQQWVDRWGPVATPLLWSHAMVLRLAAELSDSQPPKNPITPVLRSDPDGRLA
jgi:GH15 family glucan-1,4-alpha-glucosidase